MTEHGFELFVESEGDVEYVSERDHFPGHCIPRHPPLFVGFKRQRDDRSAVITEETDVPQLRRKVGVVRK